MTPNQRAFADEYIKTRNATRAYMAAYPGCKKENTARALASRLLTNDNVSAYIEKRLNEISDSKIADAAEIMEFLTGVMRGESKDTVLDREGYEHDVRSRTNDRIIAAEKLAKMLGVDKKADRPEDDGEVVLVVRR